MSPIAIFHSTKEGTIRIDQMWKTNDVFIEVLVGIVNAIFFA